MFPKNNMSQISLGRIIVLATTTIPHFKGLGMRNLQYEIRICQKIHNKVRMSIWSLLEILWIRLYYLNGVSSFYIDNFHRTTFFAYRTQFTNRGRLYKMGKITECCVITCIFALTVVWGGYFIHHIGRFQKDGFNYSFSCC